MTFTEYLLCTKHYARPFNLTQLYEVCIFILPASKYQKSELNLTYMMSCKTNLCPLYHSLEQQRIQRNLHKKSLWQLKTPKLYSLASNLLWILTIPILIVAPIK